MGEYNISTLWPGGHGCHGGHGGHDGGGGVGGTEMCVDNGILFRLMRI